MAICKVENCGKVVNARGLCGLHYRHAQNSGLFGTKCSVLECKCPVVGSGLCSTHYAAKRRKTHSEQINKNQRVYLKKWRLEKENKALLLARQRRFRSLNLQFFADKERVRRSKKRSNGGSYTIKDWKRLLNRHDGMCAYCLTRKATTADHVIPVNKGGTGFIGNILPACVSCNSRKQDKLLSYWRYKNE